MFNIPLANQPEYRGQYLGSSASQQSGIPILLKFEASTIDLFQYYSDKDRRDKLVSDKPFTSIPYDSVIGVNVVNQERISPYVVVVDALGVGMLSSKNETFLLLTFRDNIGLAKNFVFKFQDNYVVCSAIQNRIAASKKKL